MYKLIVRTDDVGYTDVCNIGTFEVYDHGYGTSADVMLDTPGTVDALKRLRHYPWVSVGWHTHFWGSPVLGPDAVPSMVIPGTDRFRHDLRTAMDVDPEEALRECRAQIERCIDIMGRAPDVGVDVGMDTPFAAALTTVSKEYGMATNYFSRLSRDPETGEVTRGPVDPKWEHAKIFLADQKNRHKVKKFYNTFEEVKNTYDGVDWLLDDTMKLFELPEGSALMHGFHPGYVDYYVAHLGDYGPIAHKVTLVRAYDVEALCSQRLHDWIKDNHIELCSLTDALYGTHHYQNHLRRIGSDLCVY